MNDNPQKTDNSKKGTNSQVVVNFVKGAFSNSLYASHARAQREQAGQCTIGLELATNIHTDGTTESTQFRLGQMLERGCFNYRWPLHEYSLFYNLEDDCNWPLEGGQEIGTCVTLSFIKDDTLYQVMRLEKEHWSEDGPEDEYIILNLGGMVQFNQFMTRSSVDNSQLAKQNDSQPTKQDDSQPIKPPLEANDYDQKTPRCLQACDPNRKIIFQARLFQHVPGEKRESYEEIELEKLNQHKDTAEIHTSKFGDNVWAGRRARRRIFRKLEDGAEKRSKDELQLESHQAVFVAAFCITEGKCLPDELWSPHIPDSSTIFNYIGASSINRRSATGHMWNVIFSDHYLPRNPLSQLAEIQLIGRTVEKILHVDTMPYTLPKEWRWTDEPSAILISNLFVDPTLDFKTLL